MEMIKNVLKLQMFRFALAGLFCASIEYCIFNFLLGTFNYLIANIIALSIAILVNYVLSKAFIFEKSRYSKTQEFLAFIAFSVMAVLLNQFILWCFVEVFIWEIRISKVATIIIVAAFNYITKKYIVFKNK